MEGTFHRRVLHPPAVAFSSAEGRRLFSLSLSQGLLESYFSLAEHFTTQGHPAFCSLGSLSMALNALFIDPQRVWQGVWRWFDDFMLDCCEPLDVIKLKGITMSKLACLARCKGCCVRLRYGSDVSVDEFREDVKRVCAQRDLCDTGKATVMIVSYDRRELKQSGTGHFSPIGGYEETEDKVLIMDVARFKYPPHWVPLETLYAALQSVDPEAGRSRGYLLLQASDELAAKYEQCSCLCKEDTDTERAAADDKKEMAACFHSMLSHECDFCRSSVPLAVCDKHKLSI